MPNGLYQNAIQFDGWEEWPNDKVIDMHCRVTPKGCSPVGREVALFHQGLVPIKHWPTELKYIGGSHVVYRKIIGPRRLPMNPIYSKPHPFFTEEQNAS